MLNVPDIARLKQLKLTKMMRSRPIQTSKSTLRATSCPTMELTMHPLQVSRLSATKIHQDVASELETLSGILTKLAMRSTALLNPT